MTRIFSGEKAAPDHLRCRRSDGRGWRCPRAASADNRLCDHHHAQLRRNQQNRLESLAAAPSSAKPKVKSRRRKKKTTDGTKIKRRHKPPTDRRKTKRRRNTEEEVVAPPDMEELTTVAQRWEMEKEGAELILDLPNGVMHIPLGNCFSNVGAAADWKIGFDDDGCLRRSHRSKNAARIPVGAFKEFPYWRGARLGKRVESTPTA